MNVVESDSLLSTAGEMRLSDMTAQKRERRTLGPGGGAVRVGSRS